MNAESLFGILASGAIAAVVSTFIPLAFYRWQRKYDYKLEYHKRFLDRRIAAYEKVERIAYFFSTAVQDADRRPYHFIFSNEHNPFQDEYFALLTEMTKSNIWITEEMRNKLLNMNRFMFENHIELTNIEKGKQFYNQLGKMGDDIIEQVRIDTKKLSDLDFLNKTKY